MDTRFNRNPKYKDKVVVVGIDPWPSPDMSDPMGVQTFTQHVGATFQIGLEDLSTPTYNAFVANFKGLNPFPVDIIVGKDGNIAYISREYDGEALTAAIDAEIAK